MFDHFVGLTLKGLRNDWFEIYDQSQLNLSNQSIFIISKKLFGVYLQLETSMMEHFLKISSWFLAIDYARKKAPLKMFNT